MLKAVADTEVIGVGIGDSADEDELKIIASSDDNVFVAADFASLADVLDPLIFATCDSKHVSFSVALNS